MYKMSDEDTSLLPVSETYLKVLTVIILLILSRRFIIIVYWGNHFSHFRSFNPSLSQYGGTLNRPFKLQFFNLFISLLSLIIA